MPRRGWRVLTVEQLLGAVESQEERGVSGGTLAFYGTGLLDSTLAHQASLIEALAEPIKRGVVSTLRIAVRPEQVSDALLRPWMNTGLDLIELQVPTLWPTALRWLGHSHQPERVGEAVEVAHRLGLKVAVHTSPGLPGADAAAALDTAEAVLATDPAYVRITPTIIVRGSHLEQAWRRGIFRPLTVDEAVILGRGLLDMHDRADVRVVRFGWQPVDLRIDAQEIIEGPYHSSLRTMVESQRMYEQAVRLLQLRVRPGQAAIIEAHPAEANYLRGLQNSNLHRLRRRFRCRLLEVSEQSSIPKGTLALTVDDRRVTLSRRDKSAS